MNTKRHLSIDGRSRRVARSTSPGLCFFTDRKLRYVERSVQQDESINYSIPAHRRHRIGWTTSQMLPAICYEGEHDSSTTGAGGSSGSRVGAHRDKF